MENEEKLTAEEKEVFEFLNKLRESGETNMFGAGSFIQEEFGLPKKESRELLQKWMEQF